MENMTRKDNHAQPEHEVNWLFFLNNKGEADGGGDGGDGDGDGSGGDGGDGGGSGGGGSSSWKGSLNSDLANSTLLQKFEDTPDGLNAAFESHANLEKLLGNKRIAVPKDDKDEAGWNEFAKAMGVPKDPNQYGLADPQFPDSMKGLTIDKSKFSEVVHAHKLTPAQAKGLWEAYTGLVQEGYGKAVASQQENLNKTINTLKGKWGDAYDSNVEMGQMVINKFSNDQDMNDYLTATLTQDPRGIEFLAKIGGQFAENKIGEFKMTQFSLAPEQAADEIQKIVRDPKHPYNDPAATDAEHEAAVNYVNRLHAIVNKGKGQA